MAMERMNGETKGGESFEEKKRRAKEIQAATVASLKELLDEMPEDFILHVTPGKEVAEDG